MEQPHAPKKLSADDLLTVAAIVNLLARKVGKHGDTIRQTRDKVRKRLLYAEGSGELLTRAGKIARSDDGRMTLGYVVTWARHAWPGIALDLPAHAFNRVVSTVGLSAGIRSQLDLADRERNRQALVSAEGQIEQLQAALKSAEAELARIRPLADKYEQICLNNRESAQLPRTKNKNQS